MGTTSNQRLRRAVLACCLGVLVLVGCGTSRPEVVRLESWAAEEAPAGVSDGTVDGDPGIALVERGIVGERPTILLLGSSYVGSYSEAMRAASVGYGIRIASEAVSGVTDFGNDLLFDWRTEWAWSIEKWQPDALVVSPFFQVDPAEQCLAFVDDLAVWEECYRERLAQDGVANWRAAADLLDGYDIPVLWVGPISIRRYGADLERRENTPATIERLFEISRRADALEDVALAATLQPYDSITYFSALELFGPVPQAFAQTADGFWFQVRTADGNMHLCPYGAVQLTRSVMGYVVEGWDTPAGSPWETMGWSWSSQYVTAPCSYAPSPSQRYLIDPVRPAAGTNAFSVPAAEVPDYEWPALCRRLDVTGVVDLFEHGTVRWELTDVDRARPWLDPVARSGALPAPTDSCVFGIGVETAGSSAGRTAFTETSVTVASYDLDAAALLDAYRSWYRVAAGGGTGVDLLVTTHPDADGPRPVVAGAVFTHGGATWLVRTDLPVEVAWVQHPRSIDPGADDLAFEAGGYEAVAAAMAAVADRVRATG